MVNIKSNSLNIFMPFHTCGQIVSRNFYTDIFIYLTHIYWVPAMSWERCGGYSDEETDKTSCSKNIYYSDIHWQTQLFVRSVIIALETNMPGLEDWWWVDGGHICQFVGHDISEDWLTPGHLSRDPNGVRSGHVGPWGGGALRESLQGQGLWDRTGKCPEAAVSRDRWAGLRRGCETRAIRGVLSWGAGRQVRDLGLIVPKKGDTGVSCGTWWWDYILIHI